MAKAETAEKAARKGIDDATDVADQAVQAAEEEASSLLAELKPAVDALAGRLHMLAEQGKALAVDAGHQTQDGVQAARDRVGEHVAERPLQSLAIATAVGLAFGWLIGRR